MAPRNLAAWAHLRASWPSPHLCHAKMSCYDVCPPRSSYELCTPKTSVAVPQPIAESCNELCARQCPDSSALIQPPPVVVTFPGPILTSFPPASRGGLLRSTGLWRLPGAGRPLRRRRHPGLGWPLHLWQSLRCSRLQPLRPAPLQQEALGHLRALLEPPQPSPNACGRLSPAQRS
ncbi:uncharacterized protein LOC130249942 isoform X4 [Oenanthe melanoleuca]|uniref:uncharacterized protein LOC130249942 isoform X4 n=1 Tax=Oenanthe melanoleuca TaxID=2939378 RepID=UPI0024C14ADA|nr:uncharacterized protein LOC130249942 isoform X4 [Oenanthe melanoleuca]